MSVNIDVTYLGGLRCEITHGPSRQKFQTEAPVDNGGKGESISPTDMVGGALGACILTIMGLMAQRNGWDIAGTTVNVTKDMTATPPRRVASLRAIVTLPKGFQLGEADRAKLEAAANACPVKQTIHPDTSIDLQFVYPN
ncbi:MAG: OsmC family protein [Candidatus Sumerlaeia bacterium]